MSKILGSWSGMRKYLEQEMLADSLKGRVRYGCTSYVGMDGCHVFDICIDGQQVKRFSLETVNSYFLKNGYTKNPAPYGIGEYWADFGRLLEQHPMYSRTEYTDDEFCDALRIYRRKSIKSSIYSDNPIVRMFAVLDRRIGQRTLNALREEVCRHPKWLQEFYNLRITSDL